jgi:hypothetical protein
MREAKRRRRRRSSRRRRRRRKPYNGDENKGREGWVA